MRLLLDTQIAICALTDVGRLSSKAVAIIGDERNEAFVPAVSVWEIAMKFALGKKTGTPPFSGAVAWAAFEEAGDQTRPVSAQHAAAVDDLPLLHSDRFDRMLIAQARCEPLRLLTADRQLSQHGDIVVEA